MITRRKIACELESVELHSRLHSRLHSFFLLTSCGVALRFPSLPLHRLAERRPPSQQPLMVQTATPKKTSQRKQATRPDGSVTLVQENSLIKQRSDPFQASDFCLDAAGFPDYVFESNDVSAFFTMCSEALSAKTAASEV